tara:strand:- start:5296 stop:5448 length:153 start_codon:yes stop_codon:yes gene_type:complete
MGIDFEWIMGFAFGADYLTDIDVQGSSEELKIDIVRLQLGFFAIYIPVRF